MSALVVKVDVDDALFQALDEAYARGEMSRVMLVNHTSALHSIKAQVCGNDGSITASITDDSVGLDARICQVWPNKSSLAGKRGAIRKVLALVEGLGSNDDRKKVWNFTKKSRSRNPTSAELASSARDEPLFQKLKDAFDQQMMAKTTFDVMTINLRNLKEVVVATIKDGSIADFIVDRPALLRECIAKAWPNEATQKDKFRVIRKLLELDDGLGTDATREFWGVSYGMYMAKPKPVRVKVLLPQEPYDQTDPRDKALYRSLDAALARDELGSESVKKYKRTLAWMRHNLCAESTVGSDSIVSNILDSPDALKRAIFDSQVTIATQRYRLATIISSFKWCEGFASSDMHRYWEEAHRVVTRKVKEAAKNNVATPQVMASMPDLSKLQEVAIALNTADCADSTLDGSLERLWMTIGAHVPAKRNDWSQVRIVSSGVGMTANFVILPPTGCATIVLNDYKTSTKRKKGIPAVHTKFEELLPPVVSDALRLSLASWPREYMFINAQKSAPYENKGDFGNWSTKVMSRHLGGHVTIYGMRKAWAQMVADGSRYTIADKELLAKSMMHTVEVQSTSYQHVMSTIRCDCVDKWLEWHRRQLHEAL
jgi:hypothetical protein